MPKHSLENTIEKLREAIPLEGDDWTYLWRLTVRPGSKVDPHTHHHWVACCHVEPARGDPPVTLLVGEKILQPEPWEVVLIPPGTVHSVPINMGFNDRLTFALAVSPGDDRQVIKNVVR